MSNVVYGVFHGLMPHNDRYPFLSRDWHDIDCKASACIFNSSINAILLGARFLDSSR